MNDDFIKAEYGNVFVDHWDNGGVWLSISIPHGGARIVLTKEQGHELIKLVQQALDHQPEDCSDEVFERK
jgi:hypothetical protein